MLNLSRVLEQLIGDKFRFEFLCPFFLQNTEATIWNTNHDQRLENALRNSAQWNSIQPNERAIVYIPVPKYPVKSQEPIAQNYANNYIQKPNQVLVNRPPSPRVIHRPPIQPQPQLQYAPFMNANVASNIPVPQPERHVSSQASQTFSHQPMHSQFGSQNVDEYLLHGQMPLTLGQTYVIPDTAQTPEPEYFT